MKKIANIINFFVFCFSFLFFSGFVLNLASPNIAFAKVDGHSEGPTAEKINICHNADSGWKFMDTPAGESLDGHLGHGDFLYTGPSDGDKDQWCINNQPGDVCANISALQISVPDGMEITGDNQCTPIPPTETQQCDVVSDTTNIIEDGSTPATLTWVHPNWVQSIVDSLAKWIWNGEYVSDPTIDETETFTKTFTVGGPIDSANIKIAADNGYILEINGNLVVDKLAIENNFSAIQGPTDVKSYLVDGTNTIKFTVKNFARPGYTATQNPAGLLYSLSIVSATCSSDSVPEKPKTSTVTMCKLDTEQNPLSGWTLMLKGENVQSGLSIPVNTSSGVDSTSLQSGVSYIAKVVGTWLNQGGANPVDAEYSTTDSWTTHMDGYTGYGPDILELQINNQFDPISNWGTYSNSHTYAQSFVPTLAGPANFRIFDGTGTTQNEGWFGDNSGNLTVDINKGYSGITGENGCTTFNEVPYGTYTTDEIMKDGWENVSGLSEVVVDDPTETFTIVNRLIPEKPTTGNIEITKYECPLGTNVVRSANGVGGTIPEGCVLKSGATFGYVHGSQTDANSPWPELSEPLINGGATSSGVLTISNLPATGRYLIVETNESNTKIPDGDILGLYCEGDGDTSNNNDNQELTFVPAGGTTHCVAYNKAPIITEEQKLCTDETANNIGESLPCTYPQVETVDMCPNIEGAQESIPEGKIKNDKGECITPVTATTRRGGSYIFGRVLGASTGEVLGDSTTCEISLEKYLRKGYNNDIDSVKKLQKFLNEYMQAGLKVDGIFGTSTENAVKEFQLKHSDRILSPWKLKNPTGIFYITTQNEVNNILCPDLKLPTPELVPLSNHVFN